MARSQAALLFDSRMALYVGSQGDMGTLLGASRRSGQRWERQEASPTKAQWQQLARLVYPKNGPLAAEIAVAGGTTVEVLGLVPKPEPSPASAMPAAVTLVDSVVLSAAEALDASPRVVRPVLYAAFARARQLALTVEVVEETLRPKPEARPKLAPKRP